MVEAVVVVLRRTAQDKQDNSHDVVLFVLIHLSSQLPCRHIFISEFADFINCFHCSQSLGVSGFTSGFILWSSYSPTAQRLMSGPSSMPSGQAHVYLGEWSVICGAFRHRYSHPPLGRLPTLQASGAGGTEAESADDPTGLPVTL